ncbi:MAG TPA: queuosine precursor transporter [Herpetosiphonaceae bacterium]
MSRSYRYLEVITGLFVAVLLISNIASTKFISFGPFDFDGGTLLFPLSYIFGDILTEVYGYARSRKVIWTGFLAALLMSLTFAAVAALPASAGSESLNAAFNQLLGLVPRIVVASLIAYFAGEFANSYTLARLKVLTNGRYFWMRALGSTLIGEGVDTLLFVMIAFVGVADAPPLLTLILSNYVFKLVVEVVLLPVTYGVVSLLKRAEQEDYYDRQTNFNPFLLSQS